MMKKNLIALGILFLIAIAAILTVSAEKQGLAPAAAGLSSPDAGVDGVKIESITYWVKDALTNEVTKYSATPSAAHIIIDIDMSDIVSMTFGVKYKGPDGSWGMFTVDEGAVKIQTLPLKSSNQIKKIHITKGFSYTSAGTRTIAIQVFGDGHETHQVIDFTV